jgi:hypothetical protein
MIADATVNGTSPIDWNLVVNIAVPIITLFLGAWLDRVLEAKSRLVYYVGHVSAFKIRGEQTGDVFTHAIVLRNGGRKSAINVRIGHHDLPPNVQIHPAINYEIKTVPDTGQEIVIPQLVANEQITISYLYFPPATWDKINSYVKSDDGFAKRLQVIPTRQYPQWVNRIVLALMTLGLATLIYFFIMLLRRFF